MHESVESNPRRDPARPATLTVDFHQDADGLVIVQKRRGEAPVALFLWLVMWTVMGANLAIAAVLYPGQTIVVGLVPFGASWLFVAGCWVWSVFGKETLLLRPDAALFRRTALVRLTTRVVPWAEIVTFRECSKPAKNDCRTWGIEMATLGKPVRFAFRVPLEERRWLVRQLKQFIANTVNDRSSPRPFTSLAARRGTLRRETTIPKPPSDCRWTFHDRIGAFEFRRRGTLSFPTLGLMLFFNAFGTVIISSIVIAFFASMPANDAADGWFWYAMFLFLIPFEVFALLFIAGLVNTLLEPFRRTIWRFESDQVVGQKRLCGFRCTRRWDVSALDLLELRRGPDEDGALPRRGVLAMAKDPVGTPPFSLAFVTAKKTDNCRIDGLTEGEARWIARAVFDRRDHWFDG